MGTSRKKWESRTDSFLKETDIFNTALQLLCSNGKNTEIIEGIGRISEYIVTDSFVAEKIVTVLSRSPKRKKVCQERRDFALSRVKRTYERLKEKKICVETMQDLLMALLTASPDFSALLLSISESREDIIPKEDWYTAIEAVMLRRAPNLIPDQNCTNFTSVVTQYKEELWSYIICMSSVRSKVHQQEAIKNEAVRCREQEKILAKIDWERQNTENEISILQGRLERAVSKNQELKDSIEKIYAECQRESLSVEAKNRKTISDLKKQVLSLEEENNALKRGYSERSHLNEDAVDEHENLVDQAVLPKERVLFLGGHENMLKKLRQRYPGWTYIGDENFSQMSLNLSIDICFVWYKHLSHKVTEMVQRKTKGIVPVIYLNATNMDYLEKEMVIGYIELANQTEGRTLWERRI